MSEITKSTNLETSRRFEQVFATFPTGGNYPEFRASLTRNTQGGAWQDGFSVHVHPNPSNGFVSMKDAVRWLDAYIALLVEVRAALPEFEKASTPGTTP